MSDQTAVNIPRLVEVLGVGETHGAFHRFIRAFAALDRPDLDPDLRLDLLAIYWALSEVEGLLCDFDSAGLVE